MKHSLTVAAMILLGTVASASAVDGHGNAEHPSRSVTNTGSVSGGPVHRDDAPGGQVRSGSTGEPGRATGESLQREAAPRR